MKRGILKGKRMWIIVAFVFVLLFVTAGVTASYFIAKTNSETNEFVPSDVSCAVEETFDGYEKTNVTVRNTGNIDAYIRAAVVINWVSENNENSYLATAPILGSDYILEWGQSGWMQDNNGFWYYTKSVAPGSNTTNLIDRIQLIGEAPEGYRLSVKILASAIQADPVHVVVEDWGVTSQNGNIIPVT